MNKKRGEITSSQIVNYLIVIVGFGILIYAIVFIINIEDTSENEVCRLSVLTRATSPEHAQRLLPLKCTTKKYCLSTNGTECEAFIGEDFVSIPISKDIEKGTEEIEGITANAIFDCWNIMGQGKLNIFGGGKSFYEALASAIGVDAKKSTCVICNRIALAKDIQDNKELLDKVDVNGYLTYKQAPGTTQTFLNAMTDNQVRSYPPKFVENFTNDEGVVKTDEIGVLFTQIETGETPYQEGTSTASTAGTFIIGGTAGLGALGGLVSLPGAILAGTATAASGGFAAFQTWENRQVSLGHCEKFTVSKEEAFNGCSVVTTFDYHDIEGINQFCGRVEGTP